MIEMEGHNCRIVHEIPITIDVFKKFNHIEKIILISGKRGTITRRCITNKTMIEILISRLYTYELTGEEDVDVGTQRRTYKFTKL